MKAIPRLLALAALLTTAQISPAAAPSAVNYQGRFTNLAGVPQPGIKAMSLKIHDAPTASTLLYSESVGNVTVDANGVYGFQFGASGAGTPASLANALAASAEQWLELTVDGAAQAPRQKILAVPFALTASGLPDGAVSSAMIADGAVGLSKITGLGTAATSAATDYATAAQGLAATTRPLSVAAVGTSITNQGSILVTDANPRIHDLTGGYSAWLEHLSNHRIRIPRRNGTLESATDKSFGYGGFGLAGLTNGAGGVYPLDNAIASGAEVLVLEGGTNDISGNSSSTVITRITNYWTKAAATKKKVIALNVLPTGSNSTNRDTITAVNASLPALATSLGITLIDTHSVATKDGSGFATTETLWDGVHPTPAYAHRLAVLIDAQLASSYANRPQEMIVPASASGLWITPSNSPTGTSIPSGWAKTSTMTDTYSLTTDANGTTWQKIRMVQGGAANTYNEIYCRTTSGFSAGDRVRFAVRIRAVANAAFDVREVEFSGRTTANYATWQYITAITGGFNLGTGNYDPITGLFVSPIFTIPSGTVAIDVKLGFYYVDMTCEYRQLGVFKVIENP